MCDDSNGVSRRKFLGSALTLGAGAFLFNPYRAVVEGIADAFIDQAVAETTGTLAGKNYVNIFMFGAPSRYQFDHWLKTNSAQTLTKVNSTGALNVMTCDSFSWGSDGKATPIMTQYNYGGFLVPHIFSQQVYSSTGTKRNVSDLLKNMLVIRGFATGFDGHIINSRKVLGPVGGVSTVSGLAAENQVTTFSSVCWPDRGTAGVYLAKSRAQTKVPGNTPLTTLVEGFATPSNAAAYNLKTSAAAKDAMELAQARLKSYAKADTRAAAVLASNLDAAAAMMKKGVSDVDSFYTAAVAKYTAAINASVRELNIPGISTSAIVSDETKNFALGSVTGTILSKSMDMRTMISNASIQYLAGGLAVAEYLLKQGLAASIEIRADVLMGLTMKSSTGDSSSNYSLVHDQHETGSHTTIFLMNAFYRGLTAGLLEFINAIGPTVWANTVVQIQGDFARSPRANGSGSDHGFDMNVTSVISGTFTNGPIVAGNIEAGSGTGGYAGTNGTAVPISGYVQTGRPNAAVPASSVVALLNVEKNPYAGTAPPLVRLDGSTLSLVYPSKIVA